MSWYFVLSLESLLGKCILLDYTLVPLWCLGTPLVQLNQSITNDVIIIIHCLLGLNSHRIPSVNKKREYPDIYLTLSRVE